uniref:C2H2-type domain-containing protein n=1 Tax=Pyrodinium bahamense TaxID=73915 RepID=A0A7S0B2R8_9DINO|mmetsp:Transcript_47358/g.131703  ORF Transcript_47358/g.131703 Transcript_47358/m.131703 type:complete len:142 (+) Transcript_47358:75-500(+)
MPSHIGDTTRLQALPVLRCRACSAGAGPADAELFSDRQHKRARHGRSTLCRGCAQRLGREGKQSLRTYDGRPAAARMALARALAAWLLPPGLQQQVDVFLRPLPPVAERNDCFVCPPCERRFIRLADAVQHCQAKHSGSAV